MPPSSKKRHSLKGIRKNYTYTADEIADVMGVCTPTVFRWIKEGLTRIPDTKKYYVHGSELLRFLGEKNTKNKRPMTDGQIFCCKCQSPQNPAPNSVSVKDLPNKTVRVLGRCTVCSTPMNKVVSGKKWNKTHPLYPHKTAEKKQHKGVHVSPPECEGQKGEQLCLNITL